MSRGGEPPSLVRAPIVVLAALISPVLLLLSALALALSDLAFLLFGKRQPVENIPVSTDSVSVVIPTWNGRDLLEKFLPSVMAACRPQDEILVVDNASTDGTAAFLRAIFPRVRVLEMPQNLGFGGGSNAGFRAATHDVVILLNNDMRVAEDFLAPLLEPFHDPLTFAVACQIFFSDPKKLREETGLTEIAWESGRLRVGHRIDPLVTDAFPCAYAGGGSSAFDRRKFLSLGGFDELFKPFYYEDTDVGVAAWKRGWKVLYQPRSVVYHEHRGTIGRKFSRAYINSVVKKNELLYGWKNVHDWRTLAPNFMWSVLLSFFAPLARTSPKRAVAEGAVRAFFATVSALRARWHARRLAVISDAESLLRSRGAYYRDRFEIRHDPQPERLNILFVSPYPIEPPAHGGAVFMKEAIRALAPHVDLHLLCFLDNAAQRSAHEPLLAYCKSAEFVVRKHYVPHDPSNPNPRVVREFADRDFSWALNRIIQQKRVDAIQIEYTMMAQYAGDWPNIPRFLFEHDISFQSMWRRFCAGDRRPGTLLAYMQLLRYETAAVRRFTRVQTCSRENSDYLVRFVPELAGRIDDDLRAAVDPAEYPFFDGERSPGAILFAGSFHHLPNVHALSWFLDAVWSRIRGEVADATLIVAGPGSLKSFGDKLHHPSVQVRGFVPDIRALYAEAAVLICPVLSGSGVRVKLLEAFACGIPVVSTRLGAEGLATMTGDICELGDSPEEFASAVVRLLNNPVASMQMARRARTFVESRRNIVNGARKLAYLFQAETAAIRQTSGTKVGQ